MEMVVMMNKPSQRVQDPAAHPLAVGSLDLSHGPDPDPSLSHALDLAQEVPIRVAVAVAVVVVAAVQVAVRVTVVRVRSERDIKCFGTNTTELSVKL
jgi:hypothetical protein